MLNQTPRVYNLKETRIFKSIQILNELSTLVTLCWQFTYKSTTWLMFYSYTLQPLASSNLLPGLSPNVKVVLRV